MDNDRLKHSYAVANKMIELGKEKSLSEIELQELFLLGYLHDIGYEFGTNENHKKVIIKIGKKYIIMVYQIQNINRYIWIF